MSPSARSMPRSAKNCAAPSAQVQRELGITTVLVTHDQEEAFAMADRIGVMNLGRLLEMGTPHDLYTRPATRFVATFLGAANLLLGAPDADGIRFRRHGRGRRARRGRARDTKWSRCCARRKSRSPRRARALRSATSPRGRWRRVVFTGALERLRVRLPMSSRAQLRALRQRRQRCLAAKSRARSPSSASFEVRPGQQVAIGVRRVHVLPTPLSSFTACAPSEDLAERLSHQPLLAELAARMKTRITTRSEPQLGIREAPGQGADTFVGTTVLAAYPDSAQRAEWLLRRGARDLLVLPDEARAPQRVLIHWIDEAARSATLAISASVLRHVPAEAVYVGIVPGHADAAGHPHGMRQLLDARSEAQAAHGLEMRTELHFGDAEQQLARRLGEAPGQMLIVGVGPLAHFTERFRQLLDGGRWPVLIVHRGAA